MDKQKAVSIQQSARNWEKEYYDMFMAAAESGRAYEEVIASKNAQLAAASQREAGLRAMLLKVTDKFEFACDHFDDGWVGDGEWEIIADARELLEARLRADANGEGTG